jgi:leader peptidase (prepilin peptidase)/N-methyltransferase
MTAFPQRVNAAAYARFHGGGLRVAPVFLLEGAGGRSVGTLFAAHPPFGRAIAPTLKCERANADHSPMETAAATFTGVFGAIIGSFLNVVVYRLPRRESIVKPASHCTACGATVRPYDNVPVLSWLILRGHCRNCSAPISKRYPLVEALCALLCVAAVLAGGSTATVTLNVALILLLVPIALIDLEHRIIPNKLTALGAMLALGIGTALDPSGEPARLLAGVGAGGALLLAALAYPGGMGMGDVKLAGVMGLFLGSAVIPAMLIALLAGVLYGALVMVRKGAQAGRKTAIPFGPFLAFGSLVAVFAGDPLVNWYTTTFLR